MPIQIQYDILKNQRKKPKKISSAQLNSTYIGMASEEKKELDITSLVKLNGGETPTYLAAKHPHPRDKRIRFVEYSHKYFVKWDTDKFDDGVNTLSVSGLVGQYFPKFDALEIATKVFNGRNYAKGKYKGMTIKEICDMWSNAGKLASTQGTLGHAVLECYENGLDIGDTNQNCRVVKQYLEWRNKQTTLVPYRTEFRMFSSAAEKVTGTADLLMVAADHPPPSKCKHTLSLWLVDHKFSKEIKTSNFYENGNGVCSSMPACNYSKYTLQQNAYKHLLETYYGGMVFNGHTYKHTKIVDMQLVVMHDTRDEAQVVPIPNITYIIEQMMEERRNALNPVAVENPAAKEEKDEEEEDDDGIGELLASLVK